MAEPPMPPPPPPTPTPTPPSIMPMLYYSLIIIATVAGLLAVYNLIIIKCGTSYPSPAADHISRTPTAGSISSFKYNGDGGGGGNIDNECSVCLSVFEEGEELKQLPNCKHRFHAPCIDMWLYSHTSCPLCRTTVAVAVAVVVPAMMHPREALLGPTVMV